jgi:hypothetical protein
VQEDIIKAEVLANGGNTGAGVTMNVAIGLDSTSTQDTACLVGRYDTAIAAYRDTLTAKWSGYSGIGVHGLVWLEKSAATGTSTWIGTSTVAQSGIVGELWA